MLLTPMTGVPDAPLPVPETDSAGVDVYPLPLAMTVIDATLPSIAVALTVPPPVAVKASFAPVLKVMAPEKLMVAPALLLRKMPVPEPLTAPVKETVPPVLLVTLTERAEVLSMVPAKLTLAVPWAMVMALDVAPLSAPPLTVSVP